MIIANGHHHWPLRMCLSIVECGFGLSIMARPRTATYWPTNINSSLLIRVANHEPAGQAKGVTPSLDFPGNFRSLKSSIHILPSWHGWNYKSARDDSYPPPSIHILKSACAASGHWLGCGSAKRCRALASPLPSPDPWPLSADQRSPVHPRAGAARSWTSCMSHQDQWRYIILGIHAWNS